MPLDEKFNNPNAHGQAGDFKVSRETMKYTEITSDTQLNEFMELVRDFHDGVVKEIHMVNSAFVDNNLSMSLDYKFNARVLIQRQWQNPAAIELLLGEIEHIEFDEGVQNFVSVTRS